MSFIIGRGPYARSTYPDRGPRGASGSALAFADPAALAAFDASLQPDFALASVGVVNDSYRLVLAPAASLLAAEDVVNVIAASEPSGAVWVRLYERNLPAEYQATWFVSGFAGSDANDGLTPGTALATLQELSYRVRAIHQDVTVTLAAVDLSARPQTFDIESNGFTIGLFGAVTSSAPDLIAAVTATVAGAVKTNVGAVRGALTATSLAFTDKQRLRLVSGTHTGAISYVTKVVTAGAGGVANTNRWGSYTNPRTSTIVNLVVPTVGDTYVQDTLLTTVGRLDVRLRGNGRFLVQDCLVNPPAVGSAIRGVSDSGGDNGVTFYQCQFTSVVTVFQGGDAINVASSQFLNEVVWTVGYYSVRNAVYCGLCELQFAGVDQNDSVCFDGGNLILIQASIYDQGTGSPTNDAQWVDGTSASAVEIDPGCHFANHGSGSQCWGLNNAYSSVAVIVQAAATWSYQQAPSIPGGTGNDLNIGGAGKLYAALPFNNTTTTANNGGGVVGVQT